MNGRFIEIENLNQNRGADDLLIDKLKLIKPKEELEKVIREYKLKSPNLGLIKGVKHRIELTDSIPIQEKAYPIPFTIINEVKEEIKTLKEQGIIRNSDSKYSVPSFVLRKTNGKIKLITNFISLNKKTVKEVYPFPSVEDQLHNLKGAEIFSQIDLDRGFYQIEINEEDRYKTGFVLPFGHFEYCRLPFGMANSPGTFQRAIDGIIGELEYCKIFVDDILIYSKNCNEHVRHVKNVMERLYKNGCKVNFEKSHFGESSVEYLGMRINKEGIFARHEKLEKIENLIPNTKKD